MEREEFLTQKPNNPFLRQYISYYYFHTSTDLSFSKQFLYYPGYKNALTIYRKSKVSYATNYSCVSPSKVDNFIFLYSGVQNQIRTAHMMAPFNKIGVVFRELGINFFLPKPLSSISRDPIEKSFNFFGEPLIQACHKIYEQDSIEDKVNFLDAYFLRQYCGFEEKRLIAAVRFILTSEAKLSVSQIADSCHVSRKTLLRLFQKHVGCSVKAYVDIVQFRKSLDQYLLQSDKHSLTQIALSNDYYDQSQFIRHFKKLSGTNPVNFFRRVEQFGKEDTYWTFV